ncbi:MAG TPA: L,D-transpeptidase family protein [Sphingomicrobium sp.]|nr:L,D-transpeptidase family protein [Sphingomicrobium sp.]
MKRLIALLVLTCAAASAVARPANDPNLPVVLRAATLEPGQYVWESRSASTGPLFVVINLASQRAMVYRDGVLIAASTISTGSKDRETPTGVFPILEKQLVHRSSTYDNAPMPYMQRLTSKGVALHAGNLPGFAASHGCIRLPTGFAKLLYGATQIGTPVMITDSAQVAEQQRRMDEFVRANDEFVRQREEQRAMAERALAEFERAKAEHEEAVRRHNAEMAKLKSDVASK